MPIVRIALFTKSSAVTKKKDGRETYNHCNIITFLAANIYCYHRWQLENTDLFLRHSSLKKNLVRQCRRLALARQLNKWRCAPEDICNMRFCELNFEDRKDHFLNYPQFCSVRYFRKLEKNLTAKIKKRKGILHW